MINGRDGRQFSPRVKKADKIYLFLVQLCRSIHVTFDRELKDQDIDVYRFAVPREVFLNGSVNPDNAAFYPNGLRPSRGPSGILDPRKCQGGEVLAPVFIPAPHFYLGDPSLVDGVVGLKQDKESHQFSFNVEPTMGVIISNDVRLQVNVLIESIEDITETGMVPTVYVPVMWSQESLNSDTSALFRDDIIMLKEIYHYVEIALICLGGVFLLLVIIIFTPRMLRQKLKCCDRNCEERSPLLNAEKKNELLIIP